MAFNTMKWIRTVRDKIWEETKDMSPEDYIDYIRARAKRFRKTEEQRKRKQKRSA